ncbi:MAG: GNAT family N-acetyltransferase [Chloroflexota bacterium]|nr:GNAT family N-acetyltransferase [Chloroflexota bacterium]
MTDRGPLRPPEPLLQGGLVRLRLWRLDDEAAVTAACQDPEIARWVPIPVPYTAEHARQFIAGAEKGWSDGTQAAFAIADASDGRVLGAITLHCGLPRRWALGYWIAPWARGRGAATAAVRLLSRWAMREYDLVRLFLYTLDGNEASQRTALAAGFRLDGTLRNYDDHRGAVRDAVFFSLIPSDLEEEG